MKSENIVLIGKGGHSMACVEICNLLKISYTQIKIEDLDYYLDHLDYQMLENQLYLMHL